MFAVHGILMASVTLIFRTAIILTRLGFRIIPNVVTDVARWRTSIITGTSVGVSRFGAVSKRGTFV